jgi:hypothetical protein
MKTFKEWKEDRSAQDAQNSIVLILWLVASFIIAAIAA